MKTYLKLATLLPLFSLSFGTTVVTLEDVDVKRIQDFRSDTDGNGNFNSHTFLYVGGNTNNEFASVYAFQMTGATSGSQITAADFSVSLTGINFQDFDTSVYVLRTGTSSTINNSDYELAGTFLMNDFEGSSAATSGVNQAQGNGTGADTGLKDLDAAGEASLLSYLQSNWVENDYVFLAIKPESLPVTDTTASGSVNNGMFFGSAQGGYDGDSTDASITICVIPEPSSLALLSLGMGGLLTRRARKN